MRVGFRALFAAGCVALPILICGFALNSSQTIDADVILTAAPAYEPLAALRGGERFPKGAQLLLVHDGKAEPLVPEFAASADASVSFDAVKVLFAGKKNIADKWQIWELTLADRKVRQVTIGTEDAIRPLYLPGWRFVYAQKSAQGFQMESARVMDSKALADIEGADVQPVLPLTYIKASAVPSDVLADGRILFESGFPLGSGATPELYLVYSDSSGVESYRCDHPASAAGGRWGGKQIKSGDVVFAQGGSLAEETVSDRSMNTSDRSQRVAARAAQRMAAFPSPSSPLGTHRRTARRICRRNRRDIDRRVAGECARGDGGEICAEALEAGQRDVADHSCAEWREPGGSRDRCGA